MFPGRSKLAKLSRLKKPTLGCTASRSRMVYDQLIFASNARNQERLTWPGGASGTTGATAKDAQLGRVPRDCVVLVVSAHNLPKPGTDLARTMMLPALKLSLHGFQLCDHPLLRVSGTLAPRMGQNAHWPPHHSGIRRARFSACGDGLFSRRPRRHCLISVNPSVHTGVRQYFDELGIGAEPSSMRPVFRKQ
jgi:hypothetical protein